MNKENAHLYLPLVQALVDGNDVQQIRGEGWLNIKDPTLVREPECYRIKPKPLVPYREENKLQAKSYDPSSSVVEKTADDLKL
tara:strand:+ start:96 stop:344 length:249 start_codon:yes stop_codon:yes gene_type:complete